MKNIVVIYSGDDWSEEIPLRDSIKTRKSLEDWCEMGLREGVKIYRASIDWYDESSNSFFKSWTREKGIWIKDTNPVSPDFILDKAEGKNGYAAFNLKMKMAEKSEVFNHPLFRTLLDNKLSQALFFGEFMPKSFLATNKADFESVIKKIESKKVVIKPLYGSGGAGIIIEKKDNICMNSLIFPVLVQEFLDGKGGIPGFSGKNEVADLRTVFIDHELVYSITRVAKSGSLFTNFHKGASVKAVPKKSIPNSVFDMIEKIINKLSIYHRANYSLDFMFDKNGKPYLIEMNTSPGIDLLQMTADENLKKEYFLKIINGLI